MYHDFIRRDHPLKMCSKKPLHGPHEVDCDMLFEKLLEPSFDGGIGREIDKVVYVDAESEWFRQAGNQRIIRVKDVVGE
jgi:hypothetical protein